ALPWVGAAALVFAFLVDAENSVYTTPAAVFGTALIIASVRPGELLYRILSLKLVVGIGLISYSLYLWHWPVISISRRTVGIDLVTVVPQIALMFALATVSYFYIETPLRRAAWSLSRLSTIGYGVGGSAVAAGLVAALIGG